MLYFVYLSLLYFNDYINIFRKKVIYIIINYRYSIIYISFFSINLYILYYFYYTIFFILFLYTITYIKNLKIYFQKKIKSFYKLYIIYYAYDDLNIFRIRL